MGDQAGKEGQPPRAGDSTEQAAAKQALLRTNAICPHSRI